MFNLGVTPLRVFFFALINIFEAKVSLERIDNILYYPDEKIEESLQKNDANLQIGELVIENASFSYDNIELKKHNFKA